MTPRVFFQAVTCLHLPFLLLVAWFCVGDSSAAVAQFKGFPSKQKIIVTAVPNAPEPVAKLPPPTAPTAPGKESAPPPLSVAVEKHSLPGGIEIEKHTPSITPNSPPEPDLDAERKARIKSERERLNRNAVAWQQERASGGSATAQRSLAMRYFTGDGLPKDEGKGMDLLRKAAAGGDSAAQKELAKREPAKKE